MKINSINSLSFSAMYRNQIFSYNSNDEKVIADIKKKLKQPMPKDTKNRNYVTYLKDEKNVDVIFNKNPYSDKVRVEGYYDTKILPDGTLKNRDKFFIGEYDDYSFDAKDAITALKKDMNGLLYRVLIPLVATLVYLATFFAVAKREPVKSAKSLQETSIHVRDTVANIIKK